MKQQYPSIDDLIAQERNSIGGVDRWTSAGYGLSLVKRLILSPLNRLCRLPRPSARMSICTLNTQMLMCFPKRKI